MYLTLLNNISLFYRNITSLSKHKDVLETLLNNISLFYLNITSLSKHKDVLERETLFKRVSSTSLCLDKEVISR